MDSSSLHRNPSVKGEVDVSRHKVDRSESKNGQFGWYHGTRKRLPSHLGREVFCLYMESEVSRLRKFQRQETLTPVINFWRYE